MTSNQIAYQEMREKERSNLINEGIKVRSNEINAMQASTAARKIDVDKALKEQELALKERDVAREEYLAPYSAAEKFGKALGGLGSLGKGIASFGGAFAI